MVSGIAAVLLRRALTRPIGVSRYLLGRYALWFSMRDPSQSTDDRMRPDDAALLNGLRAAVRAADPLPAHVRAGARAAFSLREVPVLPAPRMRAAAAECRRGR
jgi:hypothetical protein